MLNDYKERHKNNKHHDSIYHQIDRLLGTPPLSSNDLASLKQWINRVEEYLFQNHHHIDVDRILYIFSYLYSHHKESRSLIDLSLKNKNIIQKLLIFSYDTLDDLKPKKLNIMLKSLEILKVEIPQKWILKWEDVTLQLFNTLTPLDFIYFFDAYLSLNTFHNREWMSQWYKKTYIMLDFLSEDEFQKMTRILSKKEAFIPKYWLLKWASVSVYYIASLEFKTLSSYLSILQKFQIVDEKVYSKLLKRFDEMLEANSLSEITYHLKLFSKINITFNKNIFQKIIKRMIFEKKSLSFEILSHFLMATCLMNINLKKEYEALFKIIYHFLEKNTLSIREKRDVLYSFILIRSYFKTLNNINLPISFEDETALKQMLEEKSDKRISMTQLEEFKVRTEKEKGYMEYWIPQIASHVDIYLPNSNTIIEINGLSHYQNNELNPKSSLKTNILEALGYTVLNVSVKDSVSS